MKSLSKTMPALILALAAISPSWGQEASRPEAAILPLAVKTAASVPPAAGIQWVAIPGGKFMMGSDDAGPRHAVAVKSFEMAKTPVTNKQYKACVDAGACSPASCSGQPEGGVVRNGDAPVVCVTWSQAAAFSKWAGGRLPSEAQWEYAARSAGKNLKYPWGDKAADCTLAVGAGCAKEPAPVCSTPAGNTRQGLCDMAGNVWQWVQDSYHKTYVGAPSDGSAWEGPAGAHRMHRGGAWRGGADFADGARSGSRLGDDPGVHCNALGFRIVR